MNINKHEYKITFGDPDFHHDDLIAGFFLFNYI